MMEKNKFELPEGLRLSSRPEDLPVSTGEFAADVASDKEHVDALEEGMPWSWGNEVEAPPVIPDKADGPFEFCIGCTPLEREPK